MIRLSIMVLVAMLLSVPAIAQQQSQQKQQSVTQQYPQLPSSPDQVARPDKQGDLAGNTKLQLVKIADGLFDPVNVVSANDGSGRLFVVERNGTIRIIQDGKLLPEPFLDITEITLQAMLEQGLYDMAFHPDFKKNGKFYVHFAELLRNGDSVIVEYRVSKNDKNKADPKSARLILLIEQPWANHNGGEIEFGPDGYLYIGSGDGGWEGDPLEVGQRLDSLLGKILRIDVNMPEDSYHRYNIPRDNPFFERPDLVELFGIPEDVFAKIHTDARPEIWAYGVRNPWKFHFDRKTGDIYIAEVGQNHWEEIHLLPKGAAGLNLGWDPKMGTHCFPIDAPSCPDIGILPIAEYPHEQGACAVIGIGVVRNNRALRALEGAYLFGDYCSGQIWGTRRGNDGNWQMQELLDTALQITGSGFDDKGNLYVTSCQCTYGQRQATDTGAVWQVVRADQVPQGAETAPAGKQAEAGQQPMKPEGGAQGGGTTQAEGSADQALIAQGQKIFQANCAVCHGGNGRGTIGPALAGNEQLKSKEHVLTFVVRGKGQMPSFGNQLSAQDIAAVTSYIRNSWGNSFGPISAEEVDKFKGGGS